MTLPKKRSVFIGAGMTSALVLSASAGGADGESGEAPEDGGTISVYNCEPQYMIPGNTTENCGSRVQEQLFTGLTLVDNETYEAIPGVAESWDTEDQITWTFELSEDYTFHNGDPVTAQDFVDTFNWVVDPDNAMAGANFHDKFLGYEDVSQGEAEEMEGVRALDDHTLEFELTEPFGQLPLVLTYTSFYPMPSEAFEDIDAYEAAPIGNGRYQMDGEWRRDDGIDLERYEEWGGEEPGAPQRIEWVSYSDVDTAYMDVLSGELDIMPEVPPNRIAQVEDDFGENWSQNETSRFIYMGFPLYQEEYQDVDVRRAMSMAIDRDEINDSLFDGSQTPASGVLPGILPQGREGACEFCEFDPEAAAELYEEAGGPSTVTMYTDTGTGHDEYVEAIGNMWQQHLPIEDITYESMEFAHYLELHESEGVTGPYRLGWLLAYPSPQYAMEPLYSTDAHSNYSDYSSEEFDAAIQEANFADLEDSDELYQNAENILLEDMPVIPLWFQDYFIVHSDRVENVDMDLSTFVRVEDVVVTAE